MMNSPIAKMEALPTDRAAPSLREITEQRLKDAEQAVQDQKELLELINAYPEFDRVLTLLQKTHTGF